MVLTQVITWAYKDSLILRHPPKYQHLNDKTILTPTGRFFDTIINVDYYCHAFTSILVQHWSAHKKVQRSKPAAAAAVQLAVAVQLGAAVVAFVGGGCSSLWDS
jgi:hypothetical protein